MGRLNTRHKTIVAMALLSATACATPNKLSTLDLKTASQQEGYMKKSRIKLNDGLDVTAAWTALVSQHDAYEQNRETMEHCEGLSPKEGRQDTKCVCRIQPACSMCDGGPVVCMANDQVQTQYSLEKARRGCLASKDTTWTIYQVDKDKVYGQCGCEDNRAFSGYVQDGDIRNDQKLGRCATSRASCEHRGGIFTAPKHLGIIDPKAYDARGIKVGGRCGQLSWSGKWSTMIRAWEDPVTRQCHVHELDGFEVKRRDGRKTMTMRASHQCKMP